MSKINDGGPAFPHEYFEDVTGKTIEAQIGMSLRDYFAGKVAQGFVASCLEMSPNAAVVARYAYQVADALLNARAQGE